MGCEEDCVRTWKDVLSKIVGRNLDAEVVEEGLNNARAMDREGKLKFIDPGCEEIYGKRVIYN